MVIGAKETDDCLTKFWEIDEKIIVHSGLSNEEEECESRAGRVESRHCVQCDPQGEGVGQQQGHVPIEVFGKDANGKVRLTWGI